MRKMFLAMVFLFFCKGISFANSDSEALVFVKSERNAKMKVFDGFEPAVVESVEVRGVRNSTRFVGVARFDDVEPVVASVQQVPGGGGDQNGKYSCSAVQGQNPGPANCSAVAGEEWKCSATDGYNKQCSVGIQNLNHLCSVNSGGNPAGCSVNVNQVPMFCSINQQGNENDPNCSTQAKPGGNGFCSASGQGTHCSAKVTKDGKNDTCSINVGANPNTAFCSTDLVGKCSTSGGKQGGNIGCSIMTTDRPSHCSVSNGANVVDPPQCSTSASATNSQICSIASSGTQNGGKGVCSISSSSNGGQCSTFAGQGAGIEVCSVASNNPNGACSVRQGGSGGECTTFGNNNQAVCSAATGPNTGGCSVINSDGTVVPPVNGKCTPPPPAPGGGTAMTNSQDHNQLFTTMVVFTMFSLILVRRGL